MGLDMYLTRKIYIGAEYEHRKVTGVIDIKIGDKPVHINFNKVSYIEEKAAYWRKCNQIHKWFVDNAQKGEDDCGTYDVSVEQLQELVDLCKKVIAIAKYEEGDILMSTSYSGGQETKNYEKGKVIINQEEIHDLLPTQGGFFFGGTSYDEYYIKDLQDTIEQIEPLLEDKTSDFTYSSSW